MNFARAAKENASIQAALAKVVVSKVNTHEPEGDALSDTFGVNGIPHFVVMRPDGAVLDRWVGYGDPAGWLKSFDRALADPTTVVEKEARFAATPSAEDAARLGAIRAAESKWVDAAKYFGEAARLDPAGAPAFAGEIFQAKYRGFRAGDFTFDDVKAAADAVEDGAGSSAGDLVTVARIMTRLATDRGDTALMGPYLAKALAATEGSKDDDIVAARKDLLVLEAVHVAKDLPRAVELKKAAMEAGWTDSAEGLNEFAWWCFENKTNLEEAEALARKGVEKAPPGAERAAILDTVAEIVALRGDYGAAADLSARAAEEDPSSEHYPKQKARFEGMAREKAS